ncbi:DUF6445 family protein [Prochlorococcus sp. MIT 1303]|uniref:DUF6445 family protein n=1 Tax=Prochlorococcus sp. MIT 1303 TaxID=1723647 RepID=UPI0007BAEC53|nr:DUF6445 family protein [Prochlorococcus sp. MIT 1303]KZR62104.1 hypothetical protein PMIT1303_02307 [Prochlorococcus sp. MIT 1303]
MGRPILQSGELSKVNRSAKISFMPFADKLHNIMVVDDFYLYPDDLSKFAIGLDHKRVGYHPGDQASADLPDAEISDWIHNQYVKKTYTNIPDVILTSCSYKVWLFSIFKRHQYELMEHMCKPHADSGFIAGIVYLNKPQDCNGGTGFFHHRRSGINKIIGSELNAIDPILLAQLYRTYGVFSDFEHQREKCGWNSYEDMRLEILKKTKKQHQGYQTKSNDNWVLDFIVEMKYNRLILFPAYLLHSPIIEADWFSNDKKAQRLTQNIFVSWPNKKSLNKLSQWIFG